MPSVQKWLADICCEDNGRLNDFTIFKELPYIRYCYLDRC